MDVRLPNGKIIRGVPEGTSKEEVMQKAIAAGIATESDFGAAPKQPEEKGFLASVGDANVDSLVEALKDKKFNDVKKWVTQNLDADPTSIMRKLYDNLSTVMDGPSIAAAVLIIAEYQYKSAFVVDQEINLLACLTQLMLECNFK